MDIYESATASRRRRDAVGRRVRMCECVPRDEEMGTYLHEERSNGLHTVRYPTVRNHVHRKKLLLLFFGSDVNVVRLTSD